MIKKILKKALDMLEKVCWKEFPETENLCLALNPEVPDADAEPFNCFSLYPYIESQNGTKISLLSCSFLADVYVGCNIYSAHYYFHRDTT